MSDTKQPEKKLVCYRHWDIVKKRPFWEFWGKDKIFRLTIENYKTGHFSSVGYLLDNEKVKVEFLSNKILLIDNVYYKGPTEEEAINSVNLLTTEQVYNKIISRLF